MPPKADGMRTLRGPCMAEFYFKAFSVDSCRYLEKRLPELLYLPSPESARYTI